MMLYQITDRTDDLNNRRGESCVTPTTGMNPGRNRRESGFTLIEIMVVVFILALLAGIVVPKIMGRTDEARRTAAKVQVKNLEEGLHLYKLDNGVYPSTEQGLSALVTKPSIGSIPQHWREGGYLPKLPKDPWSHDYVYISPGSHGDYDLMSYGADGEPGGDGKDADVQSWDIE